MKHMLYFVRMVSPEVPKVAVQEVVRNCNKCQSIDQAPVHWKMGRLDVCKNWSRVGINVAHFGVWHYLMLIDCNPS